MNNPFLELSETLARIERKLESLTRQPAPQPQPETGGIDLAIKVTGYSKSKIYKLAPHGSIPCGKFGRKLVFRRDELEAWVAANTKRQSNPADEMATVLAKSAKRKRS